MDFQRMPVAVFCLLVQISHGYQPTAHDIKLIEQFLHQTPFQMVAYGLAKSAAENTFTGTNFFPFFHLGKSCVDYLNQQPTSEQYALSAALLSAGLTAAGSTVTMDNANVSVMIGALLFEIAKILNENTGVGFAFLYSGVEVTPGFSVPVIYYLATIYSLLMVGGFAWLIISIFRYTVTLRRFKKFTKELKMKRFFYMHVYKKELLVRCASHLIIHERAIVKNIKV